ncbi:MAG: DUF4430 domain-containing protein [Coriobacteriia bacterium]|nr:DUF4430 domain-containing protein [Coriobacteriia bacterium]
MTQSNNVLCIVLAKTSKMLALRVVAVFLLVSLFAMGFAGCNRPEHEGPESGDITTENIARRDERPSVEPTTSASDEQDEEVADEFEAEHEQEQLDSNDADYQGQSTSRNQDTASNSGESNRGSGSGGSGTSASSSAGSQNQSASRGQSSNGSGNSGAGSNNSSSGSSSGSSGASSQGSNRNQGQSSGSNSAQNTGNNSSNTGQSSQNSNSGASTQSTAPRTITVSIEIDARTAHAQDSAALTGIATNGVILSRRNVTLQEGATVRQALDAAGVRVNARGAYVVGINGLSEFDFGPRSGWMYSVNGAWPGAGASNFTLNAGDSIVWRYTLNRGTDIGASW